MLAKLFVVLSAWSLLSVIVALLVARAISGFREVPAPSSALPLHIDGETAGLEELEEELEEEQLLVLAHE